MNDGRNPAFCAIKNPKLFFQKCAFFGHFVEQFISLPCRVSRKAHALKSLVAFDPSRRNNILFFLQIFLKGFCPLSMKAHFRPTSIGFFHIGNRHSPWLVGERTFTMQSRSLYSPHAIPCCHARVERLRLAYPIASTLARHPIDQPTGAPRLRPAARSTR